MASYDNSTSTYVHGVTSTTVNLTIANNPNRLLLIPILQGDQTQSTTSVTVNGVAATMKSGYPLNATSDLRQEVWQFVNPPTGSVTIVCTFNTATNSTDVGAISYYNVNQTTPTGAPSQTTALTQPANLLINTASASDLVFAFDTVSYGGPTTFTPTAPAVQRYQDNNPYYRSLSVLDSAGTGSAVTIADTSAATGLSYRNFTAFTINDVGSSSGGTGGPTVTETGASSGQGNTSSTGAATVAAAGSSGATVKTKPLAPFGGSAQVGVTVQNVVIMKLDRTVVLSLANQVTDGTGCLSATNGALVAGTVYLMAYWNADGSLRGIAKVTAV